MLRLWVINVRKYFNDLITLYLSTIKHYTATNGEFSDHEWEAHHGGFHKDQSPIFALYIENNYEKYETITDELFVGDTVLFSNRTVNEQWW